MGIVEIDSEIIPTKENKYIPESVGALKEVKGTAFSTTVEVINRTGQGKVYYSRENKGEAKVHIHFLSQDNDTDKIALDTIALRPGRPNYILH